jgi:hypothetical protein
LVAVTVAHAATSSPPIARPAVVAPTVSSAPVTSSQAVASLNAWRLRTGLTGSRGAPKARRTP